MSYEIVKSTSLGGEDVLDAGNLVYHISSSYADLNEYYQFLLDCKKVLDTDPSKWIEKDRLNELLAIEYDPYPITEVLEVQKWLMDHLTTSSFKNCMDCHYKLTLVVQARDVIRSTVYSTSEIYTIQNSTVKDVVIENPNDVEIYRNIYRAPKVMTIKECDAYLTSATNATDPVIVGLLPKIKTSLFNYRGTTCPDLMVADMVRIVGILYNQYDPFFKTRKSLYLAVNSYKNEFWVCEIVDLILKTVGPSEDASKWLDVLDQIIDANQNIFQNSLAANNTQFQDEMVANQKLNVSAINGRSMDNLWLIGVKLMCKRKGDNTDDRIDDLIDIVDTLPDHVGPPDANGENGGYNPDPNGNDPAVDPKFEDLDSGISDIVQDINDLINTGGGTNDFIDDILNDINNTNSVYPNSKFDYKQDVIDIGNGTSSHYNDYADHLTNVYDKMNDFYGKFDLKYNQFGSSMGSDWKWRWMELLQMIGAILCAIKAVICLIMSIIASLVDLISRLKKLLALVDEYKDISKTLMDLMNYAKDFAANQLMSMLSLHLTSRSHIMESTSKINGILGEAKAAEFYAVASATMEAYWGQFDTSTILAEIKASINDAVEDLVNKAKALVNSIYGTLTGQGCNAGSLIPDFDIFRRWNGYGIGGGLRLPRPNINLSVPFC